MSDDIGKLADEVIGRMKTKKTVPFEMYARALDRAVRAKAERDAMRFLLRPVLDFICAHGDREDEGDQDLANRVAAALNPSPAGDKS